jgi:predicted RNA-binding Zn ribbon-like protein
VAGWTSDPAAAEFRALKPNRALLESLAQRTGGEVVALQDLDKFVRRLPARHAPVSETWTEPIWDKPAVLLLVLACFVAEWGIRRWKGMP